MKGPLVSVICICFNHERFVQEALLSVFNQTYPHIELIVVDDASADNSVSVIKEVLRLHPEVKTIFLSVNQGNCKAFNQALKVCKGEYIIDLAADDVLLPRRIEAGINVLEKAGTDYGMNFSDAIWMSEEGVQQYLHSDRFPHISVPQGDVYETLIERYFICPPTMMFTRALIEKLDGYDESLMYEDFDLQIRGARYFKFCYTQEVLVKKRIVAGSMSQKQFTRKDRQRYSTFSVCEKILMLNKNEREQRALHKRIAYEIKQCFKLLDFHLAWKYIGLYKKSKRITYRNSI